MTGASATDIVVCPLPELEEGALFAAGQWFKSPLAWVEYYLEGGPFSQADGLDAEYVRVGKQEVPSGQCNFASS